MKMYKKWQKMAVISTAMSSCCSLQKYCQNYLTRNIFTDISRDELKIGEKH